MKIKTVVIQKKKVLTFVIKFKAFYVSITKILLCHAKKIKFFMLAACVIADLLIILIYLTMVFSRVENYQTDCFICQYLQTYLWMW